MNYNKYYAALISLDTEIHVGTLGVGIIEQLLGENLRFRIWDSALQILQLSLPYTHHYKPRLVNFLLHFLLRLIMKSG